MTTRTINTLSWLSGAGVLLFFLGIFFRPAWVLTGLICVLIVVAASVTVYGVREMLVARERNRHME